MNPDNPLKEFTQRCQARIETALDYWLPDENILPQRLHRAMRYSVLNGGKRMRPILTYCTGVALGHDLDTLDGPACAIELIHAYSLVHDDLPAMDDDSLRRGKPTCHIEFDEATAILAGDALQTLAFHVLASDERMTASPANRLEMIQTLATASGSHGMVGGQAIDLDSVGKTLDLPSLENMHIFKTGALIRASIRLATLAVPNVNTDLVTRLDRYAKCIGLSFQIQDDILDEESDTATLGKTQGKDRQNDKPTYPALLGLADAKQKAKELHQDALASLDVFGEEADLLRGLSLYIIERRH